jgi:hypothetical protein
MLVRRGGLHQLREGEDAPAALEFLRRGSGAPLARTCIRASETVRTLRSIRLFHLGAGELTDQRRSEPPRGAGGYLVVVKGSRVRTQAVCLLVRE